jgi:Domain of unknown function (DUF222)
VVESAHRQESIVVARRLAAVAALLQHRLLAAAERAEQGGFAEIDPFQQTAAEVAAAMDLSAMVGSVAGRGDNGLAHGAVDYQAH